jgi:hypothetical protein
VGGGASGEGLNISLHKIPMSEPESEMDLSELKGKRFDVIIPEAVRSKVLSRLKYGTDRNGYLIEKKSGKRVLSEDGKEIKLANEKELAILKGSHIFVRNVAGYSQVLTERGLIAITEEEG